MIVSAFFFLSMHFKNKFKNKLKLVEWCPVHGKVASSILGQGAYLGCRFYPWLGTYRRQLINVCLRLIDSPLPFSLSMSPGED